MWKSVVSFTPWLTVSLSGSNVTHRTWFKHRNQPFSKQHYLTLCWRFCWFQENFCSGSRGCDVGKILNSFVCVCLLYKTKMFYIISLSVQPHLAVSSIRGQKALKEKNKKSKLFAWSGGCNWIVGQNPTQRCLIIQLQPLSHCFVPTSERK